MTETSTSKDMTSEPMLPDKAMMAPAPSPSPAAAEALKIAPQAVKRSMPMGLSIALGILLAGVLGWLVHYLMWFILIVYLSFVAATILEAPVQWVRKTGLRRGPAAVIVMLAALGLVVGILFLVANGVYSQISALSANLARAPERIDGFVNGIKHRFPAVGDRIGDFDVAKEIAQAMPSMSAVWANAMWGVEVISWLVIMFFVVLYMLVDGADHLRGARSLLPKHARLEATKVFTDLARAHRGWALASFSNVISASILISLGLYLVGIPGAILLGFVAGLGELVPNVGPFLGALPAILLTLLAMPEKFFWVVGMFIVAQTIQSYTISPQMMKFSVKLPVLVTIMSVVVFGILFNFLGILVAIPLVADMVVLWQYVNRYLEKDTTDYDLVNPAAEGVRTAPPTRGDHEDWRLRKVFRRRRRKVDANGSEPATLESAEEQRGRNGMDRLEDAERHSSGSAAGR